MSDKHSTSEAARWGIAPAMQPTEAEAMAARLFQIAERTSTLAACLKTWGVFLAAGRAEIGNAGWEWVRGEIARVRVELGDLLDEVKP